MPPKPHRRTNEGARHAAMALVVVGALALTSILTAGVAAADELDVKIGSEVTTTERARQSDADTSADATEASSDASAARGRLGDEDVVVVSGTSSTSGEDDSSSDATVISLLGNEIVGARSSSDGGRSHSTTGFGDELCDGSGGALCLALLYGDAESRHGPGGSSADSHTALAGACVNGGQRDPEQGCDGVIAAAIAESRSSSSSESSGSGAETSSVVARACIAEDSSTAACDGIGIVLLESSREGDGAWMGRGFALEAQGEEAFAVDHPVGIGSCEGAAENCLLLNDADARNGTGGLRSRTTAAGGVATATAEGVVVDIALMDQEVVRLSGTSAGTGSDGSSADVTVLSVLGHEVIGAHASSDGGPSESETGLATESCEASGGALCLSLLYGRATASETGSSSTGTGDAALGSACVGGEQTTPVEECDGAVGLTIGESHSRASQDKGDRSAESSQSTSGVDLCLGGENRAGTCEGLGVILLSSSSESSAAPGTQRGEAEASTAVVEAGGEEQVALDQPGSIAVPPGCPADASVVCVTLNDADTSAKAPTAAAADAVVVPRADGDVAAGGVSRSASTASAPPSAVLGGREHRGPEPGRLATTGSIVGAAFALAVTFLGAGLVVRRRRARSSGA